MIHSKESLLRMVPDALDYVEDWPSRVVDAIAENLEEIERSLSGHTTLIETLSNRIDELDEALSDHLKPSQ